MKKYTLLVALFAGLSMSAQAHEVSDPLAAYDNEGEAPVADQTGKLNGPVVDIAVREIVGDRDSHEDAELFVETGE